MKYNKDLFINNVKYLISYDYEPEITIRLKDDSSVFVIAYKDFIDITIGNDETIKLEKIEDVFNYIDFDSIVEIEGDIDFEFLWKANLLFITGIYGLMQIHQSKLLVGLKKKY